MHCAKEVAQHRLADWPTPSLALDDALAGGQGTGIGGDEVNAAVLRVARDLGLEANRLEQPQDLELEFFAVVHNANHRTRLTLPDKTQL